MGRVLDIPGSPYFGAAHAVPEGIGVEHERIPPFFCSYLEHEQGGVSALLLLPWTEARWRGYVDAASLRLSCRANAAGGREQSGRFSAVPMEGSRPLGLLHTCEPPTRVIRLRSVPLFFLATRQKVICRMVR